MASFPPSEPVQRVFPIQKIMTKKPAVSAPAVHQPVVDESEQQRFERILTREQFKPLKGVFDHLGIPFR